MVDAPKAAGSFLGGLANNPGIVIIAVVIGGLFLFRDRISGAFASVGESFGNLGAIQFPDIQLPSINFPEITFPTFEFPDVAGAVGGAVEGAGEAVGEAFGGAGESVTDFFSGLQEQFNEFISDIPSIETPPVGDTDFTESGQAGARSDRGGETEPTLEDTFRTIEEAGIIQVSPIDEFGIGGGPSFEGGTTTFGGGIVDTLTEVLALFPSLTSSQARDVLEENPDLTQSEFRLLDPDILNISNLLEENQTFLNAGEFTGLTAEEIADILTGGNISNF